MRIAPVAVAKAAMPSPVSRTRPIADLDAYRREAARPS
jgi:hypothetical protein